MNRARTPNISLQRTGARAPAAELGSFARASVVTAVLAVIGFSLTVGVVEACDCFEPEDLKAAVAAADAVFVGEVVSVDVEENATLPPPQFVRFKATEAWKGVRSADVGVATGGDGDCSAFRFEVGKRYLVFAKRDPQTLSTGLCMGNRWIWRDLELSDIRKWRAGKKLTK
jgi:hypothetical protein